MCVSCCGVLHTPFSPPAAVLPQFFGWMVGANTMLEYLLAGSTVAKGFASYFTTMIGEGPCNCP
jgi:hypothetical protein